MRASFAKAAAHGDEAPLWFYSHLFLSHPETRALFPVSMAHQRDRLFAALGDVVHYVDDLDRLVPMLQQLGRDHRKFGTVAEHYPAVGASLLATLEHFDDEWDDALAKNWTEAYGLVADVMVAAAESAAGEPPWWEAEVVAHERRTVDVAVLRVLPRAPFPFLPGQAPQRRVALFLGARAEAPLSDRADLERLQEEHAWLTVTPAVSEDPASPVVQGVVGEVVGRSGPWTSREVFVAGPGVMVDDTV